MRIAVPAFAVVAAIVALPAVAKRAAPPADRPPGVGVATTAAGPVYAAPDGRTLYAMSVRFAFARSSVGEKFCSGPCAEVWTPLKPQAGAEPVGEWTIVEGAEGPQWAYRKNPVFTFDADAPGDAKGDGWQDLWAAIAYVPPAPPIVAPPSVSVKFVNGRYLFVGSGGRPLYVGGAAPGEAFAAGLAEQDVGDWTVLKTGDVAQWAHQGRPVFVSAGSVPSDAEPLAPTLQSEAR